MDWAVVACLQYDDLKVDSDAIAIQNKTLQWDGTFCQAVIAMDGFTPTADVLYLSFRLVPANRYDDVGERVHVAQFEINAGSLTYSVASPRHQSDFYERAHTTGLKSRRHSVYGDEVVVDTHRLDTFVFQNDVLHGTFEYHASTYVEDECMYAQLAITSMRMTLNHNMTFKRILQKSGHKITTLAEIVSQKSPRHQHVTAKDHLRQVYLGRANRIQTHQDTRVYHWQSKMVEETSFGSITPRDEHPSHHKHLINEMQDLKQIQKYRNYIKQKGESRSIKTCVDQFKRRQLEGLRRITFVAPDFVADNDELSNPLRKLPLVVHYTERLWLSFFNFKISFPYGPVTGRLCLEWKDFSAAYDRALKQCQEVEPVRRKLRLSKPKRQLINPKHVELTRCLSEHLTLLITFALQNEYTEAKIISIQLEAKQFESSLLSM